MSINFILQTIKILYVGNCEESEIKMIYNFIKNVDNEVLNDYVNNCTILTYNNDLELFIEVIDSMIKIMEKKEEYEKCQILFSKKIDANEIIKINQKENEFNTRRKRKNSEST